MLRFRFCTDSSAAMGWSVVIFEVMLPLTLCAGVRSEEIPEGEVDGLGCDPWELPFACEGLGGVHGMVGVMSNSRSVGRQPILTEAHV